MESTQVMRPATRQPAQLTAPQGQGKPSRWQGVLSTRLRPVDAASLVYFRIAFYSLLLWEAWRFLSEDWIDFHFSGKSFYFFH